MVIGRTSCGSLGTALVWPIRRLDAWLRGILFGGAHRWLINLQRKQWWFFGVGSRWFNQFSYFLSLYALPLSKVSLQVRVCLCGWAFLPNNHGRCIIVSVLSLLLGILLSRFFCSLGCNDPPSKVRFCRPRTQTPCQLPLTKHQEVFGG